MSSTVRMPPPTVSGMKHWSAVRSMTLDHARPPVRAGGDIKEYHFIRPLPVVAQRHLDRIAHIPQLPGLGAAELHPPGDFSVMNVQAGNDAFDQHDFSLAENRG